MKKLITSEEYFKSLYVIYSVIISENIFFAFIVGYFSQNNLFENTLKDIGNILLLSTFILTIAIILITDFLYKSRIKKLPRNEKLGYKLISYRTSFILRNVLWEIPAIAGAVFCLMTGNIVFLLFCFAMVFYMFMNKPDLAKVQTELELKPDEIRIINNPNSVIIEIDQNFKDNNGI